LLPTAAEEMSNLVSIIRRTVTRRGFDFKEGSGATCLAAGQSPRNLVGV